MGHQVIRRIKIIQSIHPQRCSGNVGNFRSTYGQDDCHVSEPETSAFLQISSHFSKPNECLTKSAVTWRITGRQIIVNIGGWSIPATQHSTREQLSKRTYPDISGWCQAFQLFTWYAIGCPFWPRPNTNDEGIAFVRAANASARLG